MKIITPNFKVKNIDSQVSFSNDITRASHGLSLVEKRIVMLSISKLDSMKPFLCGESPTVTINAREYADWYNVSINTAYEQLILASQQFPERKISFISQKKYNKDEEKLIPSIRWVKECKYQEGEAWAELVFWHEVVPFLMNLKHNFTTYKLRDVSKFKSVYTWRLFEILTQYKKSKLIKISRAEFCNAMDVIDKVNGNFAYIRSQIIENAIKEIDTEIGWIIKWSAVKTGKKVTGLHFDYSIPPKTILI